MIKWIKKHWTQILIVPFVVGIVWRWIRGGRHPGPATTAADADKQRDRVESKHAEAVESINDKYDRIFSDWGKKWGK